jgi:hypothetical protein
MAFAPIYCGTDNEYVGNQNDWVKSFGEVVIVVDTENRNLDATQRD